MRIRIFVFILIFVFTVPVAIFAGVAEQDDTVRVITSNILPVIDGIADDDCWNDTNWQSIDQVWINYGETLDSSDFSGRYKIAWSSSENLLYFLVETVDDAFVDGYVYNSNPSVGGGYPNYDILEIFIDPDKSGGLHVFDGTGNTGQQWGTNGENAFSHHIVISRPEEGQTVTEKVVCDIAGADWGNYSIPDYADHFPEFAVHLAEGLYTWEFSMKVFNDTYDPGNPEASRVSLQTDQIMGLSLAYCDNDDPNEEPKQRDNFIGSVWVPESAYNDHWMNADGFGTMLLIGETTAIRENTGGNASNLMLFPNPSNGLLNIQTSSFKSIKIYNTLGQTVYSVESPQQAGNYQKHINLNYLPNGIYFITMETNQQIISKKITLIKN